MMSFTHPEDINYGTYTQKRWNDVAAKHQKTKVNNF
jgi:hypothetical protein